MEFISLIQGLWVILTLCLFFIKMRIGLCLYIAYIFLVPYMNINLGINLQWNLVNLILLLAFFVAFKRSGKRQRMSFKPFMPFLFLQLFQLLEMPFQNRVPMSYSLNTFRLDLMLNLIPPFVIWNYSAIDGKVGSLLRKTTVICICIAFGYGLFLTTTGGVNPYQIAISAANGVEWNKEYAAIANGRLFGRISSVFAHPMNYGLFLGLALVYIYSIRDYLKRYVTIILCVGIVIAIVLCGVRSPIGALFVTIMVYLFLSHKIKLMIQFGILAGIGFAIINTIPELSNYIGSIFSDKKSLEGGSSLEMRMNQLEGCFYEIRNNPFFGNGYGWVDFYKEKFGDHPVLLAFESLVYVVLCNSGYVGAVIWVLFLIKLFKNTNKLVADKNVVIYVLLLLTYYLSYTVITGEYGYMKFLILFYTLVLICNGYTPDKILMRKNIKADESTLV